MKSLIVVIVLSLVNAHAFDAKRVFCKKWKDKVDKFSELLDTKNDEVLSYKAQIDRLESQILIKDKQIIDLELKSLSLPSADEIYKRLFVSRSAPKIKGMAFGGEQGYVKNNVAIFVSNGADHFHGAIEVHGKRLNLSLVEYDLQVELGQRKFVNRFISELRNIDSL